jgi:hypothetical protein
MTIQNTDGQIVNFIVMPNTYFVDNVIMSVGNEVIGFDDSSAPAPLIYPTQYTAIVMAKYMPDQNIKVDFFNEQLISSDGALKLNISLFTPILLENGQLFTQNPASRNLIVIYGASTRSIPAQTTPDKIIVMC